MAFPVIKTEQQHDIRLTLRIPRGGRIIIEGNQKTALKFWNDVKMDFIGAVSDALGIVAIKGDFEPITVEENSG